MMPLSLLRLALAGLIASATGAVPAEDLAPTPPQPRGPFYPRAFPAESDADLATYRGRPARGTVIVVTGRVLERNGAPIPGAKVEIWQTNAGGRYHHEGDDNPAPLDPGFQGWGQATTGADGAYRFRTVRPAPYPGRTPHIHVLVAAPGKRPLVTQMYFDDRPENRHDGILAGLSDAERRRLTVRLETGGPDALARFDIVLP